MKVIKILLVEDDAVDTIDIKRTLDKMNIFYTIFNKKNGEEALRFLKYEIDDKPESLPDIVLIDINMPRINGLELLTIIRATEEWKHLKCFIITTSGEKIDKEKAISLGASGYIVKPLKLNNSSSMDVFNLLIDLMNMKD